MALAVLVALAALAPLSAIIHLLTIRMGSGPEVGASSRRRSQVGATLALSAATAVLGLVVRGHGYGITASSHVFPLGVATYVAASIWWTWAWSWPASPPWWRWWLIWSPAAPWIALFMMGIWGALHPVEAPPYLVLALYALTSAGGVAPSAAATIWLRNRTISRDAVDGIPTEPPEHRPSDIPVLLLGLPLVAAPLLALGEVGGVIFVLAVFAHVVGADWLLIRKPAAKFRGWAVAGLQLAIGAPSALFAISMTLLIGRAGDVAWMDFPFVVAPALLIWPVLIVALARGPTEPASV